MKRVATLARVGSIDDDEKRPVRRWEGFRRGVMVVGLGGFVVFEIVK